MNSLDIDLLDGEVIHRKDLDAEPTAPGCRQLEPTQPATAPLLRWRWYRKLPRLFDA